MHMRHETSPNVTDEGLIGHAGEKGLRTGVRLLPVCRELINWNNPQHLRATPAPIFKAHENDSLHPRPAVPSYPGSDLWVDSMLWQLATLEFQP